mgnify:CR=1 FL=1
MSSWVELIEWNQAHQLGDFPWDEWIVEVGHCIPLPVYDLLSILDASAAYDMAVHAKYWQPSWPVRPVHIPDSLRSLIRAIRIDSHTQQMYMARALYAHCVPYVCGTPRITNPPRDHIDHIPLLPVDYITELQRASKTSVSCSALSSWLESTIRYGSTRPLTLHNVHGYKQPSCGRRSLKRAIAKWHTMIEHEIVTATEQALHAIHDLAPGHVPHMHCYAGAVNCKVIMLVLCVQRQIPSDV